MATAGLRSYLEALDEPALVVEAHLVALANDAARKLFGNGIEGRDVRLTIRHPQALEQILSGSSGDVDITGIGELGRPWTLSIRGLAGEAVLVRLIDRSAAVAAEKMRVDFVANASHELRTPLSTILGYAETLAEDAEVDPEHRVKFGQVIRDEAKAMLRIIEDLMSLSRIEAGRFVGPTDLVSLDAIARMSVSKVEKLRDASQCQVELEVEEQLPKLVGDQGQLEQLLDNLLANAVRYGCMKTNCVVRVRASVEGNWIRLSVADNGPGIPEEHLPLVTARFYRVDAARSRGSGGTGLGLAIVKHIVERHKGTLEIRSKVGEGTEVTVRLPLSS